MKNRRIAAETLIELAAAAIAGEIGPTVPPERRYTVAMVLNALAIARREIITDGDTPLWELIDTVYPEGDGNIERLAADIRSGEVHDGAPPDLAHLLKQTLIAELRVRNPRFLKSRGVGG